MVHVIASFVHSAYLELAITSLIKNAGVAKENILAVPLDKGKEKRTIIDTIHQSDGVSVVDGALALGTAGMVLGTIYGFVLAWGAHHLGTDRPAGRGGAGLCPGPIDQQAPADGVGKGQIHGSCPYH